MNEVVVHLAEKFPNVKFVKVAAEDQSDISEEQEISAVPTFLFFKVRKTKQLFHSSNPKREMMLMH